MTSSVPPFWQTLGNICSGLAALVVLWPLRRLLSDYAGKFPSDNRWVPAALYVVSPLWLLLMGALVSMTASGGFDWLRLGRPALYVLTVASAVALAAVTLLSIAMYIRPGFTPRGLYVPVIYLVPLATMLLVVLSLNQRLAPGISTTWLRVPWTGFAAVSLVACVGVVVQQTFSGGLRGVVGVGYRLRNPGPSSDEIAAKLATLDPQRDFAEMLRHTGPDESAAVRDAVVARLRTNPQFIDSLSAALTSRSPADALSFLYSASLTPAEQQALALPARKAIEAFTSDIPAPNYMPPERRKQLQRWGRKTFPVIIERFAGTSVDFSKLMPDFEHALRPDDSRR
jgi:hypothetical protein